jgi:hypothetical protein
VVAALEAVGQVAVVLEAAGAAVAAVAVGAVAVADPTRKCSSGSVIRELIMLVRANEWKRHLIAAITLSVVAAVALFASAGQSTASSRLPSCCDSIAVALAKEARRGNQRTEYKNSFWCLAPPM